MVGVILAAGDGRRLKNSSKEECCKPLIKINRKRLIAYSLDNLINLGIKKVYIVVGKEGELIKNTLGDTYKDLEISYVIQQEQQGLINAFTQAVDVIGCEETIILQLSDEIFTDLKVEKIKSYIETENYDFYCGITYEDDPDKIRNNFSVETDNEGKILECIEKPLKVINNIKGTGFCIFNGAVLQVLNDDQTDENELYDLCDYINYLIKNGKRGLALNIAEREFNINTFSNLLEVQNYFE